MRFNVKLLVQPGDGLTPLIKAIDSAKKSVEILIFRCDRSEIERALDRAAQRGVVVNALIANTNRGGAKNLRKLELRLLSKGITVARTADDLLRYHGKMMIVDRRVLYLLAFNFTEMDTEHSRTFGLVINAPKVVNEAVRLFAADSLRRPFKPKPGTLLVSPANARTELTSFLKGARKELLIFCAEVSDSAIIRLLQERAAAGVDVKIIGKVTRKASKLQVHKPALHLHTRTIIRDRRDAFIGSQGFRQIELDSRREVGLIFRDPAIIKRLTAVFEEDWSLPEPAKERPPLEKDKPSASKVAKKVAKAMVNDMPSVAPVLKQFIKEVVGEETNIDPQHLAEAAEDVRAAVKDAVKGAVKDMVQEVVEGQVVESRT